MTRSRFTALVLVILGTLAAPQKSSATVPTTPIVGASPDDITYYELQYTVLTGETRTYLLNLPPNYQHGVGDVYSLVFFFHGAGGTAADGWNKRQDLRAIADANDVIVVFPQGHEEYPLDDSVPPLIDGYTWNAMHCCGGSKYHDVDDVGFIAELVDHLTANLDINTDRIHATGFSNGGMFTHRLAAELPDVLASVAAVGGTAGGYEANRAAYVFPPESNFWDAVLNGVELNEPPASMWPPLAFIPPIAVPAISVIEPAPPFGPVPDWSPLEAIVPSAPIPVMMIRGLQDELVPYTGGQAIGLWWTYQLPAYPSNANTLITDYEIWQHGNNCTTSPLGFVSYPGIGEVIDCETVALDAAPMQLIGLENMSHQWPTLSNANFDGALHVMEFFRDHHK